MTDTPPTAAQITAAGLAPAACTLPNAERPLRASEFIDLLGTKVLAVREVNDRHTSFELTPDPEVAARAADLCTRETQCCSFFAFALTATGGKLTLDVQVPSSQVSVLAALTGMAGAGTAK